jgi:hypothetical protein
VPGGRFTEEKEGCDMKRSAIIAIALIIMLIPGALLAESHCASKAKETCKPKCCKEMMDLTEEQMAKLGELKMEHEIATIKLEAELKVLKLKMKHAMAMHDATAKELKGLVSNMAAVKEKMGLEKIDKMMAAKKIMGPENWKLYWKCCGAKAYGGGEDHGKCSCGRCGAGHGCCSRAHHGCASHSGCEEKVFIMKGGEGQAWIGSGGCHELRSGDAHKIIKCIKGDEGAKKIERCIKVEKKK